MAATFINIIMYHLRFPEANIIMVYLLGIVLISYFTSSRMYGLLVSLLIVGLFNFFYCAAVFPGGLSSRLHHDIRSFVIASFIIST
ncbi:MAG: DUF4118 domain-containing protein [[Clostridium] innocuum]